MIRKFNKGFPHEGDSGIVPAYEITKIITIEDFDNFKFIMNKNISHFQRAKEENPELFADWWRALLNAFSNFRRMPKVRALKQYKTMEQIIDNMSLEMKKPSYQGMIKLSLFLHDCMEQSGISDLEGKKIDYTKVCLDGLDE